MNPGSQPVDLVLANGRVTDGATWPREHQAIAVANGRVVAVGSNEEIKARATGSTELIDVGGRRVVPGLIDGHLHVIRTGLSYGRATSWNGIRCLEEGYTRLAEAASDLPEDEWLFVPGGWTLDQVEGHQGPVRESLDRAAPSNPAYVQCAYGFAQLNTLGLKRLLESGVQDEMPDGALILDSDTGEPTGRIEGVPSYGLVLDRVIGGPTLDEEKAGTKRFLSELRRLGLTGAIDAGGFRSAPESYRASYELARSNELDFRLRLYVHAEQPGDQVAQIREWVRHARPRAADPWVQITGIGEVVHYDCHDSSGYDPDFRISDDAKHELKEISRLALDYGWAMHAHAIRDRSIADHVEIWESLGRPDEVRSLRFSIAHGEMASEETLQKMAHLGIGIGVQARMYDTGLGASKAWGETDYVHAPRLGVIEQFGLPLSGGTDGAVGHTYNPWEALSWFVTGRSVSDDVPLRDPAHRLSRARALDIYTNGSAWFSFEENERGRIAPGYLADLAVLDADYFEIDEDALTSISAWMTVVNGKVAHSSAG